MDNNEFKPKAVEMTVNFPITEEDVSCLIANAMALGDSSGIAYWWYDDADYKEAKAQLIAERKPDSDDEICYEDVMARILFNGHRLRLLDAESDWWWKGHKGEMLWKAQIIAEGLTPEGGDWYDVYLKDILDALPKYAAEHCCNDCGMDIRRINEDGDSTDADAVFQIAIFGEVIYG